MKDKLQVVLITYNRKNYLKNTLEELFADNSPIKDYDITIIDNCSTDGTGELVQEYLLEHKNLKYIKNKINIGGNANICKAFVENLSKEYIWVLADNDTYNWTSWDEVERAVNDDYDIIIMKNCKNNVSEVFYNANLISAAIYKTKNITSGVVENMYDNIRYLFPHLAIAAKNINEDKSIYIVSKDIVILGLNPNYKTTIYRGRNENEIPVFRKNMYWSVGFFNSIELIKDRKRQIEIIENLRHYHKSLFQLFRTIAIYNKTVTNNYYYNLYMIYRVLSFKQKIKFILACLTVNLSFKNYEYWFIRYKEEWIEYLSKIDEQKYINKLVKKLKNKKVILYGAGMLAEILLENYDLSKLNIIGISDKKFADTGDVSFHGYKAIKPNDIKDSNADVILFTMKLYKPIEKILNKNGIKQQKMPIIKNDVFYPIRVS